jgi:hypothetical protein
MGLLIGGVLCGVATALWIWLIPKFNASVHKSPMPRLNRLQQVGGGILLGAFSLTLLIVGTTHLAT